MKSRNWLFLLTTATLLYAVTTLSIEPVPSTHPNVISASAEPEPSPEPESEPESEPEGEPEGETTPASYAEPEPQWDVAIPIWGKAWPGHIYLFGVAFGVVALYSLFSIIRLWKRKHLLSQKYFISLNLLIFLMGSTRSVYLLVDGYNSKQVYPEIVSYMLYTLFLPCVTSTFSLLFLSLLAATRMKFISPSIQKTKVILCVIFVHFALAIVTDVLTVCHLDARVILFVCQVFYIVWGLFLFVGFMYIFGRLYKAAVDRQAQMNKYALKKLGGSTKQNYKPENHKLTLSLGTIVTLISSILGLLTVVLLIYGMVDVYGVFEFGRVPEPWRWWGYHTTFRALELAICITVSYVATQPFRYSGPTRRDSSAGSSSSHSCSNCYFICAPCWSWCQREQSYLLPDVEWSELRSEVDSSTTLRRNESEKSDLPLHHVVVPPVDGDEQKKYPESPELGQTAAAMLKSDHGVLHFSNEDRFEKFKTTDVDNLALREEEITAETDQLLQKQGANSSPQKSEQCDVTDNGVNTLADCDIRWSEQSLDRVSQMTPEMESNTDDEISGLLADV